MPIKWPLSGNQKQADNIQLLQAARDGNAALVKKQLARFGANVNYQDESGWTPLNWAAFYGRTEVVKALLGAEGVDVNLQTKELWTALTSAAANGQTEVMKALLGAEGVDVNLQDKDGVTPLRAAALNGHTAVVKALLGAEGIDINLQDKDGWTPLMAAAENGRTEVVKALLGAEGVDVNLQTKNGWTPLMLAARYGHTAVVKVLLGAEGVDVNLQDKDGRTALDWATSRGYTGVAEMLRKFSSAKDCLRIAAANGTMPTKAASLQQPPPDKAGQGTSVDTLEGNPGDMLSDMPGDMFQDMPASVLPSEAPGATVNAPQPVAHASVVHRAVQVGTSAAWVGNHLVLKVQKLMLPLTNLKPEELKRLKQGSSALTTIIGNGCKAFPHELVKAAGEVILFLDSCHSANEYCRWKVVRVVGRLKALLPALAVLETTVSKPSLDVDQAMMSSIANTLICLLQVLVELVVLIGEFTKMRQNRQQFLKRAAAFLGSQGLKCELDDVDRELQSCVSQLTALLSVHAFTSEAAAAMVRYQDQAVSGQVEDDIARRQDLKDLAGSLLKLEGGVEELRNQMKHQTTTLHQLEAWLGEVHSSSIEMTLYLPRIEEKLDFAIQLLIRRDVKPQTDQKQKQRPAFIIARQDIVVPEDSLRNGIAGGYGTVLKAERDGRAVALKIYNYQTSAASHSLKEQEAAVMEAYILQQASHHNIVRCFGVVYDPTGRPSLQGSLVMEWVNGGNLFQWLHRNRAAASLHQRVSLAAQVAAGMKHIHGQKIRHGDLKPENVLVCEVDGQQEAKICDFGLAVYNTTLGTKKAQSLGGTVAYLSPERLGAQTSGPSYKDDVYAFGIVMHVILTSSRPYPLKQGDAVTQHNVQAGKMRPNIDAALSNCQPNEESSMGDYISLARQCWHQAPEERPGFPEIYSSLMTILDQIASS